MRDQDLEELASLSALDALTEEECAQVAQQAAHDSELAAAIDDYCNVTAQLAYSAPLVTPPADLKQRLWERIGESPNETTPAEWRGNHKDGQINPQSASSIRLTELTEQSKAVEWEPYEAAPDVFLGTLHVNLDRRMVQCFVRTWGPVTFPRHNHAAAEEIIVLEGDLTIGDRHYQPGDRITTEAGAVHQPQTQEGCLLFLHASLDNDVVPEEV